MSNTGCYGYVVKAIEFKDLLPKEQQEQFKLHVLTNNVEDVEQMLADYLPDNIANPESLFILNDDDESDDLERGVMYACYDECQLFEMTPKSQLNVLRLNGISPDKAAWVKFG